MALTRDRVVEAAVALADEVGLDGLTMRALGRSLGVEAMSLYRYVQGKEDLLDAIHEHLLATLPPPPIASGWAVAFVEQARAFRALLGAHRGLVPLFAARAAATPAALQRVDRLIGALDAGGFDADSADHAFQVGFEFVVGHAMFVFAPGRVETDDDRARFEWGLEALVAGITARRG